jgi:D-3-phosphoglycerate dehydrogenase
VIVDDEVLRSAHVEALAPSVRVIGRSGTGLDALDLEAARRRGVSVLNLPAFATTEAADHTVALILAALRRLPLAGDVARSAWHEWRRVAPLKSIGDCTIGIVGGGRIGAAVIERLRPFGPRVLLLDPALEAAPAGAELAGSLDELLTAADVVSLHVPLVPGTRGMIGARELGLMKRDAILVNVSRGEVVDEAALVAALRDGSLGGAALDVVASEPPDPAAAILSAPRTLLTPHVAWLSEASMARARDHTLLAVAAFLRGEELPYGALAVDARSR